jgi:two-component system, NtrC family, response regulator GlrR
MIGNSPAFRELTTLIAKLAPYDVPVLIEGETGTGKELAARTLHYNSPRQEHPFLPVNCGAIPDTLFESELFGHRRGAFTGARDDQPGLVVLAHRGTLFLDEVDALTAKGQVTLLRFLQDQQYRPVGGRSTLQADVRVVAAANRSLEDLAAAGQFRQDLLYRLKLMYVRVPPLRERQGDPRVLAEHFLWTASRRFRKPAKAIAAHTLGWFERYSWPGNVRELEHLVYREFILSEGAEIQVPPPPSLGTPSAGCSVALSYRQAKAAAIEAFERHFLTSLMARSRGCVSAAARLAQTERRHLGKLLKRYSIDMARSRSVTGGDGRDS